MGHSIGLDDHYFKPSENDVSEEYITAVDWLTINEENRLKKKKELSNKQDEIEVMKERPEQEMKTMREQMSHIMLMIQQNPTLAQVNPEPSFITIKA
jgi:hypothetical protein